MSVGITEETIRYWEQFCDDWFFVFAVSLLILELLRYWAQKRLDWQLISDTVASFMTLAAFIGLSTFLLLGFYLTAYSLAWEFALFAIPINGWSILAVIILADLAYYWEHRFAHRVNLAWATHSVHHSSPYFNISVAYRFGPMDGLWPLMFHLPLVLLGFNPFLVFFAETVVQLYQTVLHTEVFKRLPRPIEWIMNTPSHHRVHHGSNPQYLDRNYAGIFIVWDRIFGTFEEEKEAVIYGLVKPIDTANPLVVFGHGIIRLIQTVWSMPGWGNKLAALFHPPGWRPTAVEDVDHISSESQSGTGSE